MDVHGAEVATLREALVCGLHAQLELDLRVTGQRSGRSNGAQLRVDGEDVLDVSCRGDTESSWTLTLLLLPELQASHSENVGLLTLGIAKSSGYTTIGAKARSSLSSGRQDQRVDSSFSAVSP